MPQTNETLEKCVGPNSQMLNAILMLNETLTKRILIEARFQCRVRGALFIKYNFEQKLIFDQQKV